MFNVYKLPSEMDVALHNVYLVKYDDTVSFMTLYRVPNTIRRRGGYRDIITEEGVDTVTYFGEIQRI